MKKQTDGSRPSLTRRGFLKGVGALGAAAAATPVLGSCAAQPKSEATETKAEGVEEKKEPIHDGSQLMDYENTDMIGILQEAGSEEEFDFVVVGSGVGGLTAAMIAAEQAPEAKILLVEKLPMTGGNGNFAEINVGTGQVTKEQAWETALGKVKASSYLKDVNLLASLAYDAGMNSAWTFVKHGIKHDETNMYYENRNGSTAMTQLVNEIRNDETYKNVEIRTSTRATALLMEDPYTCTGIQLKDGAEYVHVKAKAVYLATGGMATNLELLSHFTNEDVLEKCFGIGAGQDGDGHLMVQQTAHGLCKSVHPTGMFHNVKGFSFTSPLGVAAALQATNLMVNQFGQRYSDELINSEYPFIAEGKALETNGKCYSIMGQNLIRKFEEEGSSTAWWYYYKTPTSLQEDLKAYESNDDVYTAETLEELAEAIGLPVEEFVETVETYEADVASGSGDSVFGKPAENMVSLGEGPYWAFRVYSGVCQTNGGIRVDEYCRVCDPYFVPVSGLYSGGISVSGLNTELYSTGTSQAAATWSGRKWLAMWSRTCWEARWPKTGLGPRHTPAPP